MPPVQNSPKVHVEYQPVKQDGKMDTRDTLQIAENEQTDEDVDPKVSYRNQRRKTVNIVVVIILVIIIASILTVVILFISGQNEMNDFLNHTSDHTPPYIYQTKQANITGKLTVKDTTSHSIEEDFRQDVEDLYLLSIFRSVYNDTVILSVEGDPVVIDFIIILSDVGDDIGQPRSESSSEPKDAYDFCQIAVTSNKFKHFSFSNWQLNLETSPKATRW